MTWRTVANFRF